MTKGFLYSSAAALILACAAGSPAMAQDADEIAQIEDEDEEEADEDREQITVTGSRIRRDEFSSAAPLQVLDAQANRGLGVIDTSQLIQQSTTVSGEQVTLGLNTASGGSNATEIPPDGGVGSANVGLRGLDASRTLVLQNGRRIAAAGTGGVPTRPDLSLLPSSLVERVEILTGGATSIYGADAVAGVVNIITKTDFEGFEVEAFRSQPEASGGEQSQLSFIMGTAADRGQVMFAGEFYERTAIQVADRDYASCNPDIRDVIADDGSVIRQDICISFFPDQSVLVQSGESAGELWFFTPGFSSTTLDGNVVPDWSFRQEGPFASDQTGYPNSTFAPSFLWAIDTLPNGQQTTQEFGRYNDNDERLDADLLQGTRRFSFAAQGDYQIDLPGGFTPTVFFENFYSNRQTRAQGVGEQALPELPGFIPTLNAEGTDWVRDASGEAVLSQNPLNPFQADVEGIILLDEDFKQIREAEVEQIRFVGGIQDEFDSLFGFGSGWSLEAFGSYDRSIGYTSQDILSTPAVFLSTQTTFLDQNGDVRCGIPEGLPGGSEVISVEFTRYPQASPNNCVPVNWLAPSVLEDGSFETAEELEFVRGTATNRTIVEQTIFGGFVTGNAFQLPAGPLGVAFGAEYRIDKIKNENSTDTLQALIASETIQSQQNAQGETYQRDIFFELDAPLLANKPYAHSLNVGASIRYTDEKNFGSEVTYAVSGIYEPVQWLALRGNYATAFRAPNLREQFINEAASATAPTSLDPCRVPGLNRVDTDGDGREDTYIGYQTDANGDLILDANGDGVFGIDPNTGEPLEDGRDPNLIQQCFAGGADPFGLGFDGFSTSFPVFTSGAPDLDPETAETYTAGFVLKPDAQQVPIMKWFVDEFDFSATYYNIEIEDSVAELSPGQVVFGCYDGLEPTLDNPFCERVTRVDTGDPAQNALNGVVVDFINVGAFKTDGIDLNMRLSREQEIFGQQFEFGFATSNSYILSFKEQATPDSQEDQDVGEDFRPRWTSNHTFTGLWEDFEFAWRARWISQVGTGNRGTSSFNGFSGLSVWPQLQDLNNPANGNVQVISFIDDYWEHDASVRYSSDMWSATLGVSNVFDNDPPRIDADSGITNRNGVVAGGSYDVYGRYVFVNLTRAF